MNEQTAAEAGGLVATFAKTLSAPWVIGIVAGAVGFMFSWPHTKREGFCRIAAAGICSHFFGPGLLATAVHFLTWIPVEEMRTGCYLVAGLPGWWVLAFGFKWLENRQGRDAADIAAELAEGTKKVKELL